MNFFKKILAGITITAALASMTQTAKAQAGAGFDYFYVPRPCLVICTNTTAGLGYTNTYTIDRTGYTGVATMITTMTTNQWLTNAVQTNVLQTSPDQTNWVNVPYAQSTNTSLIRSNLLYGLAGYTTNSNVTPNITNGYGILATNFELLPGTPTTPSIASAGFGTPYLADTAMTNTNAITFTTDTTYAIGFNISDCARYIRLSVNTYSNVCYSAVIIARRTQ